MNKIFSILFLSSIFVSCMKGIDVDLVVYNAKIHTIDNSNSIHEAMAIKDGKIIEVGPERQILNKYSYQDEIDALGKDVYPGFTDAHGHILSLINQRLNLDLTQTKSFNEVLFKLEKYKSNKKFILARGWDQANWDEKDFPTNEKINELFPNIPVILIRVDGHAALVNEYLLKKAGLNEHSIIDGGKILVENESPTGIILDNAITEVMKQIPSFTYDEKKASFLEIQEELLQFGITSVHEAGIENEDLMFFQKLNKSNKLKLNLYAMLYPTEKNIQFAQKNGIYHQKNLLIRSFKIVGDGSLGSHGACLKQVYSDNALTHGHLITSLKEMKRIAQIARKINYQVNTHAIGDSTNKIILDIIAETFKYKKDHRWRIEHAQVLDVNDIKKLGEFGAFPSVQPQHAVSDQRWAEARIGKTRMKGAYAYQSILNTTGIIAFGTDFPVESFDPFLTIHAATNRKNANNQPYNGFLSSERISFSDCIKAMTLWPAFASFQESKTGSLEKGKDATFVIFESPININSKYKQNFSFMTFIKGKKVYSAE